MHMKKDHVSVLLDEVRQHLELRNDGVYLDCTFGAGGYSESFLLSADCKVCAIDRDSNVLPYAERLVKQYGDRFAIHFGDFANLDNVVKNFDYQLFDGIAFDIGVSSMQIDQEARGFSFYNDGPLDMRMDQSQDIDATYITNTYSEEALASLIFQYGDERKSKAIAKAIVMARVESPIVTTLQLANLVLKVVGRYNDNIHPATRTFQALRIVVNDELGQLQKGLLIATNLLKINGRMAVVTFHSGEDQIVKSFFTSICGKAEKRNKYKNFSLQKEDISNPSNFALITKKSIAPSKEEVRRNVRARSAKLRVIERIA